MERFGKEFGIVEYFDDVVLAQVVLYFKCKSVLFTCQFLLHWYSYGATNQLMVRQPLPFLSLILIYFGICCYIIDLCAGLLPGYHSHLWGVKIDFCHEYSEVFILPVEVSKKNERDILLFLGDGLSQQSDLIIAHLLLAFLTVI